MLPRRLWFGEDEAGAPCCECGAAIGVFPMDTADRHGSLFCLCMFTPAPGVAAVLFGVMISEGGREPTSSSDEGRPSLPLLLPTPLLPPTPLMTPSPGCIPAAPFLDRKKSLRRSASSSDCPLFAARRRTKQNAPTPPPSTTRPHTNTPASTPSLPSVGSTTSRSGGSVSATCGAVTGIAVVPEVAARDVAVVCRAVVAVVVGCVVPTLVAPIVVGGVVAACVGTMALYSAGSRGSAAWHSQGSSFAAGHVTPPEYPVAVIFAPGVRQGIQESPSCEGECV